MKKFNSLGPVEGTLPDPRYDPFSNQVIAALDAKKPKLEPMHTKFSRINAARRRYVLGDDSAFDET
jgi:hypothetical protein